MIRLLNSRVRRIETPVIIDSDIALCDTQLSSDCVPSLGHNDARREPADGYVLEVSARTAVRICMCR
jgi:hypothetical protein